MVEINRFHFFFITVFVPNEVILMVSLIIKVVNVV